jgi:hypothetical protein
MTTCPIDGQRRSEIESAPRKRSRVVEIFISPMRLLLSLSPRRAARGDRIKDFLTEAKKQAEKTATAEDLRASHAVTILVTEAARTR